MIIKLFWPAQGWAVSLRCSVMVDYNRLKDHGRRIAWEFTFRPLYLSTDVHTYGLNLQGKNPIEDDNYVLTSCPLYILSGPWQGPRIFI